MSHPPIPPKSRYFEWNEEDQEWDFIYHEYKMNEPHKHHVGLDWFPDWNAPYIAAVAEVEWRKRADKWSSLAFKWYGLMSDRVRGNHKRAKLCQSAKFVCEDNARLWREWGKNERA